VVSSHFKIKRATISHSDAKSINTHVTGMSMSSVRTAAVDKISNRGSEIDKRSVSQLSHMSKHLDNLGPSSILKTARKIDKAIGKDMGNNVLESSKFKLPQIRKIVAAQSLASGMLFLLIFYR
jgi:hypothetical protein